MFKIQYKTKNYNLISINQIIIWDFYKKNIWFFVINVVGRIFKWFKYTSYVKFILPTTKKPYLFINTDYYMLSLKSGLNYLIITHFKPYTLFLKYILSLKNPSIFNKRGYRIYNRIIYKKKGKITTYITNK